MVNAVPATAAHDLGLYASLPTKTEKELKRIRDVGLVERQFGKEDATSNSDGPSVEMQNSNQKVDQKPGLSYANVCRR